MLGRVVFFIFCLSAVSAYRKFTLCKGQNNILRCPVQHQKLQILSAVYGRLNSHSCAKSDGNDYKRCKRVATNVEEMCSGKQSCPLVADAEVLGVSEPLCGANDYLTVSYRCSGSAPTKATTTKEATKPISKGSSPTKAPATKPISKGSAPTKAPATKEATKPINKVYSGKKQVSVCEYNYATLQCSEGNIDIVSVFWGRKDRGNMCSYNYGYGCKISGAYDKVTRLCKGYSTCTVDAVSYVLGRSWTCWSTKQLEIVYRCEMKTTPAPTKPPVTKHTASICENGHSNLVCKNGGVVSFTKAIYHNTSNLCSKQKVDKRNDREEKSEACKKDVLLYMKRYEKMKCIGKTCLVGVDAKFFGDACPKSSSNVLELSYDCIH